VKILLEERVLRYAVPALYSRMVEILSTYTIHPYDVQATAIKNDDGYEVSLRFTADFSQSLIKQFSFEQIKLLDDEVNRFFHEAAEKCKSFLIADYYKMMKL
jgi:hypothetical protein